MDIKNFECVIELNYEKDGKDRIREFVESLVGRIEGFRDAFFWGASSRSEKDDNDEVRTRERRGDKEFNYKGAISRLLKNISGLGERERESVMERVLKGVCYRITGIYVNRFPRYDAKAPLLADVAENPGRCLKC